MTVVVWSAGKQTCTHFNLRGLWTVFCADAKRNTNTPILLLCTIITYNNTHREWQLEWLVSCGFFVLCLFRPPQRRHIAECRQEHSLSAGGEIHPQWRWRCVAHKICAHPHTHTQLVITSSANNWGDKERNCNDLLVHTIYYFHTITDFFHIRKTSIRFRTVTILSYNLGVRSI